MFGIDLMSRSCDYNYKEVAGLLSAHVMAVIKITRYTTEDYLLKYFTNHAYLNTYTIMFKPISDKVTEILAIGQNFLHQILLRRLEDQRR